MTVVDMSTGEIVARSLDELEAVIERGIETFKEVGIALSEIRDARLYKATHATFDDYCNERWGFDRRRASAIMIAAEVSEISDIPVTNEAHASALAPLRDDPEKLNAALEQAVADAERDGAKLTADRIRKAVDRITKPSPDAPDDLPSCGSASGEPFSEGVEDSTLKAGAAQPASESDLPSDLPEELNDDESYVAEFLKRVAEARKVFTYDAARLAAINHPDALEAVDGLAVAAGKFRSTYQANQPGLRVVQ